MGGLGNLLFGTTKIAVPHPEPTLVETRLLTLYAESLYASVWTRDVLRDVRAYCMFVGYPRSGHSLLGSIIDAHPHAICSHELDALRLIESGFSRNQIYSLILKNSAEFARHERVWTFGYKYEVPGQWNGRFEKLLLVGDKKGGVSSLRFARDPHLLERLRRVVGPDVRLLHVVRNPFDNIAAMVRRGMGQADAVHEYFGRADAVLDLSHRVDQRHLLTISHERLVASPSDVITDLCRFLGLDPRHDYIDACCRVVNREPHKTRALIEWDKGVVEQVRERSLANPFLRDYTFE